MQAREDIQPEQIPQVSVADIRQLLAKYDSDPTRPFWHRWFWDPSEIKQIRKLCHENTGDILTEENCVKLFRVLCLSRCSIDQAAWQVVDNLWQRLGGNIEFTPLSYSFSVLAKANSYFFNLGFTVSFNDWKKLLLKIKDSIGIMQGVRALYGSNLFEPNILDADLFQQLLGLDDEAGRATFSYATSFNRDKKVQRYLKNANKAIKKKIINEVLKRPLNNHWSNDTTSSLAMLYPINLFNQNTIERVLNIPASQQSDLWVNLQRLENAKLLNADNYNKLLTMTERQACSFTLPSTYLSQNYIDYLSSIADRTNISNIINITDRLHASRILTEENLLLLTTKLVYSEAIEPLIRLLHSRTLLTEQNYQQVLTHAAIFHHEQIKEALGRIPSHAFTQALFDELIAIAVLQPDAAQHSICARLDRAAIEITAHDVGQIAVDLAALCRQLGIPLHPAQPPQGGINYDQSIHNKYVEESVKESFLALERIYHNALGFFSKRNIHAEITNFIKTLNVNDLKEGAAKRALEHIQASDFRRYGITTSDLMVIVWRALWDKDHRNKEITDEEAKKRFIQSLYEIQRGYNLVEDENHNVIDRGGEDAPICESGTFNKIVASLHTLHTAVNIRFITDTIAFYKLEKLVQQVVKEYLTILSDKKLKFVLQLFKDKQIAAIASDEIPGIEKIYKTKIEEPFIREFGEEFRKCLKKWGDVGVGTIIEEFRKKVTSEASNDTIPCFDPSITRIAFAFNDEGSSTNGWLSRCCHGACDKF